MKVIKNISPPEKSSPFNPAKNVDIAANSTDEIKMNGVGGNSFGVSRILPFAPNMEDIYVTARLNEDLTLFRSVQLAAVHEIFKTTDGLLAPFIIQAKNDLTFELENRSAASQNVNIELIGFDHFYLSKLKMAYEQLGVEMPLPRFLYGHAQVGAGKNNRDLGVKSKSVDVEVKRMAMSSDRPGEVTASLKVYNSTIRNEVYLEQLNSEFDNAYAGVPFIVGSKVSFDVRASNRGAQTAEVSFLGECYALQRNDNGNQQGGR